MVKKSLIQGLFVLIGFYIFLIFFSIFEIKLVDDFIFTQQGFFLFYIFISIGVILFMRI